MRNLGEPEGTVLAVPQLKILNSVPAMSDEAGDSPQRRVLGLRLRVWLIAITGVGCE